MDINQVIDLMVANNEPEEKIMEVINSYNNEQAGKQTDSTVDPTMSQDDMGSQLADGSSESPTWGSQLGRSFDPKGSIMPDLYTKQKRKEEIEISEKERKSTQEYSNDKKSFEINLNAMFKNPNTLKEILGDNETLQNVLVGKGGQPVRNPEAALKDYVHDQVKGFGWISNGNRNIDPKTGKSYYPNLTNRDIDELIDSVFDQQYSQESANNRNNRIAVGEGGDDNSRKADILTFNKGNKEIANLVEQINHGGLEADEIEEKFNQLTELKKKQGKTDMLFNYNTGQLILPKSKEDKENLLKEDGVEPLKDKSADYQGLTLRELALEYKGSSLALGGLNKELNEVRTWEVDNPAYSVLDSKEKMGTEIPKRIKVTKSVREFLTEGYDNVKGLDGQTDEEWNQEKERLRDDKIEYTANHEALKRMYLLNDGLLDIKKSGVETAVKSFVEPFIGRYGTDAIMGGQSERVILDKVGEKYGELGIPIDKKEEKYLERDLPEMINEGLFGSGRILAEFYAVGKLLKPIEYATGLKKYTDFLTSSRYRNQAGKTWSEAAIKSRASANALSTTNYAKKFNLTKVDPTIGMRAKSLGIAGLMEGAKFEGITRFDTGGEEGGAATGFGFGVAGRMIAPLAPYLAKKGYLKDIDFKRVPTFVGPLTKRVYTPGNLSGQALFQQFVSAPASFVVGSEAGEIMHGIVDDAFGNKQYSQFMDEHYGDYGETGKRIISNYFIGIGFGMAGPHGSMFKGFADFKSETGIRKTRNIAFNAAREILNKDAAIPYTEIAEGNWGTAEMQNKIISRLSKKKYQEYQKHAEVYHGMNGKLLQLQRAKGYMDPLQSRDMVEKDMQNIVESNKQLGIKTEVEVVHNNNLQPGQKAMTVDAEIITKDGGKRKIYRYNAETYTPDVKAHEVSHDFFETQFEKDAIFKGEFMTSMNNIAKKIELERFITEKEAASLGKPNRAGQRMNLSEAISLEKNMGEFDKGSSINNQRISQWELFSHIAQQIGTKANYLKVKNSDGYMQLGKLIKDIGKKNNQKYNLSLESDVVRWFRDYSKNVKKSIDTRPMFAELESVIDYGATMQQRINMRAEGMKYKVERGYESKDLDAQKNTFLDNQRKSLEGGKETPLYSIDKHLFKNDGSLRYKTLEEFKNNREDFAQVYYKIFGSEKSVFDAKIKEGMTDKGIPDKFDPKTRVNPMNEFVRKVKDKLLTRLNKNFNPDKGGGSLFGYFENTAIPYEKIRVSQEYIKEGGSTKTRLEDVGEMQAPTEARVKRFETQNILEQQLREARAKKEGIELKTVSEEGRIFSEVMGRDKSGVQTKITEATKKQKIDLDKTKPIYKTLKKWLTEVELIERDGKKVKPTKEADARPIGVLSEVMKIVSAEYGVPLKRLLANQTLDSKMRSKARDYIKNKITEIRKGVFPEGETPSGVATGAANTSWKSLYEFKGKRGEVAKGKTAAGKEVVEKRTDITDAEILEKVGINPKTGEYVKGTKFDSAIKELIKFDATIEAKQTLTTLGRGIFSDSVIGEMGAGRPEGMASKNLEKQGFGDQVNFLFEVQGKTFEKMFKRNVASIEDPVKAINKTLTEYFTDYKARGNEFNISNADLRTIGKELHKEYKFTKLTPTKIASKAAKAITMPNDLRSIDIKAGLEPTPFTLNTLSDLVEARAVTRVVAKALVEKYGDGVYEAMLLRGESGGKGVGTFGSIAEMVVELKKGQNRFSLHEASEAAIDFMSDIINSKGKKYSGPTSTMIEGQGNKAGQMRRLIDKKTGEWNKKALNESYEAGEFNKKVLKDAVEALREAYKKGDITHTQARQWVEIHGGPMSGLIKLAGSFAVVPNMSPKQMFKLYPEMAEKVGKDGKKKMASNYVLEHTTPAQYVKARIYDYIINGGEAKKSAMDLTLKDYHTTLIPEKFDVMVNKTLQTDLPSWHLPGMDPIASRYYEANHPSDFGFGLRNFKTGKVYDYHPNLTVKQKQKLGEQLGEINNKLFPKGLKKAAKGKLNSKNLEDLKNISKALELGRKKNKEARGMSTFDFDETLREKGKEFVTATKGNESKKISSEKFPVDGPKLAEQGYKFDFKDFINVKGGVEGPLMQKLKNQIAKYGNENVYVLTARMQEAAPAIHAWLKSRGVKLPIENITGLGNSTGEAKALWMLKKFSEGYNDMYFVDDAISNVKAVKNVLDQLDIKSKVQQALQSKDLNKGINNIMEHSLEIGSEKVFSKAEAKVRGKDIKRRRVFMRDSAADLELLIEPLYGKGKKGIENKKWLNKEFVMPFERGIRDYNTARQSAKNDYINLRKQNKDVVKEISKEVEGTTFTNDMAMRVYLWNKAGYKIPDLAKTTEAKLVEHIQNNPKLQAYAEQFARITKQEKGLKEPGENWWGETMAGEVTSVDRGVSRKQYLQEWIDVKNEIFTTENLNKMESKLGTRWRENIEDMFDRMETGRTRSLKMDRGSAAMMNYLNGGIGTIMNFNTRSAVLQTISTANFLNMRENNPIAAARAMGNAKQFAKDFKYIMNSDMLKQRRDGLAMNVTEAEIASAAASSKNPVQSIISKVLKAGYTPTKMADSFAISFGGATFYRNRIKMYEKQGMKTKEAEKQAFLDFQVIAERTQQSSRADLLSKQQTSLIGRFILPFANTPMQMNRAGMKDILDISKGRFKGGAELTEKIGRISYYMGAQVAVFAGLQSALFAMLLNDDDVSDDKIANTKSMMLNTTTDSFLRGFGIQGAIMSAFKNATQEYFKQSAKPGFTADYSEVAEDLLNISPPIGSKFGMLDRAGDTKKWAKIKKNDEFKFELGNPSLEASLMTIQATTNAPVYSPYQNMFNMSHALSDQYETWQRVLMGAGWTPYSVGVETEKKQKQSKSTQSDKLFKLKKQEQIDRLERLGVSKQEIKKLKYEKDRVNKLLEIQKQDLEKLLKVDYSSKQFKK